jgi:hypothetical protein
MFARQLTLLGRHRPADDPAWPEAVQAAADCSLRLGHRALAETFCQFWRARVETTLGPTHPYLAGCLELYARVLRRAYPQLPMTADLLEQRAASIRSLAQPPVPDEAPR